MSDDAMTDKVVILARGLGTRMRKADGEASITGEQDAVAETGVKALIPIDRPFLDYVISALADAGYGRVCLVIGPEHDEIRNYYRDAAPERVRVEFAVQESPRGTGDAVASAEAFADGDPFVVLNSDNYYPVEALAGLRALSTCGLAAFTREGMMSGSNVSPDRLTKFAVISADEQGNLRRVIEKPDESTIASLPDPVCVSMNCWRFGASIFEACRNIPLSARGELEITDAVQYAIDELGETFRVLTYDLPVLDLSSRADIAPVAERLAGTEVRL